MIQRFFHNASPLKTLLFNRLRNVLPDELPDVRNIGFISKTVLPCIMYCSWIIFLAQYHHFWVHCCLTLHHCAYTLATAWVVIKLNPKRNISIFCELVTKEGIAFPSVCVECTCRRNIRSLRCHTEKSGLHCTKPVELFYYTDMLYSIRNLHK